MKAVVLCAKKMNYDHLLDFSTLCEEVAVYDDADETKMAERLQGAEILITKENQVTAEMIQSFPDTLKIIVEAGTGYNNIDLKAASDKGLLVCNVPSYSTDSVAQMAMMFILMCASSMKQQISMLDRADRRNFTEYLQVDHDEVCGKTLGVIGEGHIGGRVVALARAFGMQVLVYRRRPLPDREGVRYVSLPELLENSDYISLHCPLTEDTRHLISREALAMMKPTAWLVNTSRGPLIDQEALLEALRNHAIAGAALDVQEYEPLDPDSPLFDLDNVILTPHIGWQTKAARQRLLQIIRQDIEAYRNGAPVNVVNN